MPQRSRICNLTIFRASSILYSEALQSLASKSEIGLPSRDHPLLLCVQLMLVMFFTRSCQTQISWLYDFVEHVSTIQVVKRYFDSNTNIIIVVFSSPPSPNKSCGRSWFGTHHCFVSDTTMAKFHAQNTLHRIRLAPPPFCCKYRVPELFAHARQLRAENTSITRARHARHLCSLVAAPAAAAAAAACLVCVYLPIKRTAHRGRAMETIQASAIKMRAMCRTQIYWNCYGRANLHTHAHVGCIDVQQQQQPHSHVVAESSSPPRRHGEWLKFGEMLSVRCAIIGRQQQRRKPLCSCHI